MLFFMEFISETIVLTLKIVVGFLEISILVLEFFVTVLPFVTMFELLLEVVKLIFKFLTFDLFVLVIRLAVLILLSDNVKLLFPVVRLPLVFFNFFFEVVNCNFEVFMLLL
jgi:hypothetical protein